MDDSIFILVNKIIRNFIARGMNCTENIILVWQEGSEADAWILYRSLLDRLLHLHDLIEQNSFTAFDEFSFLKIYEARQRIISNKEMYNKFTTSQIEGLKRLLKSQKTKYLKLKSEAHIWYRPKAEETAMSMGLNFLYQFGYDYASMYVHPMASDGEIDFIRLTSPEKRQPMLDPTVVSNSILIHSMLIQEGLNGSRVQWRAIIYDFLDQLRENLRDSNSLKYQETFNKISSALPKVDFCKPR